MWLLPILIVLTTVALSVPVGRYLAKVMDGRYSPPALFRWFEARLDTGPQNWKQYTVALLLFNTLMFVFGYVILVVQPFAPLNQHDSAFPDGKLMLSPTTIFNTAVSFMTNTNLQHYSGEQHLSYFSQLLFVVFNMFTSAAVGFCALAAVIRGLRGDTHMGNYYLDMWRVIVYVFIPASVVAGVLLILCGMPMTLEPSAEVKTVQAGAMGTDSVDGKDVPKPQVVARGPVAAILPIKHFGTNGGGFFGANSAHPYENPSAWTNFIECVSILVFPFSLVVMFGRMLRQERHAAVIYSVMMLMFVAMIGWAVYHDSLTPNPAFTAQPERKIVVPGAPEKVVPPLVGLPVDQSGVGNLEGKELRFGPSAGATFSAVTTAVTCGSVNCMHDSLNPLAGITPMVGMMLNCVFGGKGVGLINMLIYLVVGVFLSGLMVGRTPEYLGKKIEAKEMKLAMLALLVHPLLVLGPTGLFAALDWGKAAESNPGAHGFSEILYEFTSSSANNGSGFEGLGDTYGFNDGAKNLSTPAPYSPHWDIATGLVMLLGRFVPIIAPLALAGSLATKKRVPFTAGTLRTDTVTFGFVLLGTVLLVGALLFLPALALGPVAEHLGPMPFGR
ncbi:potassium-transporting ATPase subunit KdpA [Fimbriiglobus ruber]|uniref:Potassium-transporting ATPase potassium-binding subunit n=1 Tax=Fimbriiglobus ruber TaxID=1908690 RepID=A0A225E6G1_9BACT|nr:potassium-transporting ATPase subunit KdpA [Fimbriiglobus ruber]OWK46398.1 Potassium-transporting ATPase A chain [Fimbriiglobus ruber]